MKQMSWLAFMAFLLSLCALPLIAETPKVPEAFSGSATCLPIGVFAVPRDLLYLAKMKGFEVVHNYRFEESRDKNDELAAYLDEAHKLGLEVMVGFERKENYTVSKVVERVRRFRDHPALWAWYLCDEPKMEIYDRVAEIAAAIRREDAGHPLAIATDVPLFAALADLIFAYTYPVWDRPFPQQDLGFEVRRINQAAKARIPFLSLVQTFNWNHYLPLDKRRRDNRHPTAEEMRFMAFYGVMKRCRGVFFFSFQTLPVDLKENDLSRSVSSLLDELKAVRNHLVGEPTDPGSYTDYPHAGTWSQKESILLLLTNPTPKSVAATLKSGLWTMRDFKNPKEEIPPGKLRLEPWGVRVVLVRENSPPAK